MMSGHDVVPLLIEELLTAVVVQACEGISTALETKQVIIDFQAICSLASRGFYRDAAPFMPLVDLRQMLLQSESKLVRYNLSSEISDVFRIARFD